MNLLAFLEIFPDDMTVGEIKIRLSTEQNMIEEQDIRCRHRHCGRLIFQILGTRRWTHIAPDGTQNRGCRAAAYDDPKPGDTDKQEWLNWPSVIRTTAAPPQ